MLQIGPGTDGRWRVARDGTIIGEPQPDRVAALTEARRLKKPGEPMGRQMRFTVIGKKAPPAPALTDAEIGAALGGSIWDLGEWLATRYPEDGDIDRAELEALKAAESAGKRRKGALAELDEWIAP